MFEKVNPSHPDKLADRIAGALVDYAYTKEKNPRIAVEVLIGHGCCHIIAETSVKIPRGDVETIVRRISGVKKTIYDEYPQDAILAHNQDDEIRCGDNGIFAGVPLTAEQRYLCGVAECLYEAFPFDGKMVTYGGFITVCQSNCTTEECVEMLIEKYGYIHGVVNPIGDWTGGTDVDTGATNRKLGSDMGDSVTGGGLHGKDLSKADVSVNIYAWLKAQFTGTPVKLSCSIGDSIIDGRPYSEIVNIARQYIKSRGGFEKFAEWGLLYNC